ncbi:MAG: hypothetical protein IKQ29_03530 [Bacilli bacterium]|nr:hypothetical protein [Bacilli bacterium]
MKKEQTMIILVLITIFAVLITCILFYFDSYNYGIITTILSLISLSSLLVYMKDSTSNNKFYESTLNNKIKSYSSIMVEADELPFIEDRNIIVVSNFEGLIDAQRTIKKPVYYKKEIETCVFILIDNKEAIVHIYKQDPTAISPYELQLRKIIARGNKDIDHSILDDLEKTTIIKFDNMKKYRVQPIREKDPTKKNKNNKKKKNKKENKV